jgi:hypothetical protein
MTTPIKKLLTALAMSGLLCSIAVATSVREYQAMRRDEKIAFLVKETNDLLTRVNAYDPQLANKTRLYMLIETNEFGGGKGLGAVLAVVDVTEKKHPETMDKIQVETITKVIMRNYWKKAGVTVPASVLGLKDAPAAASTNAAPPVAIKP